MKNNIFKKTFIIIAAILLPLVFSIVAATWFMISEENIEPIYNPNSLFYKHLNAQYVFYDGLGHIPQSDSIDFDKLQVTYECRNKHNDKPIETEKPTEPGQYIINFSSPLDETEEGEIGYQTTDVVFTILPKFETKFYSNTLITNTTQGNALAGTFTIDPSTLTRVKSTYVSNSNPIVEYTARISFTKNTGSEYSNFNVSGVLVSFYGVADINNQYYATIDDAIKAASSNNSSDTINIMVNSTNPKLDDSLAKTIGAISFSNNVTIASGDTLLIAYRTGFDDTNKKYTHNPLDNTYEEAAQEWGANFKKDDGRRTFADCDSTNMANFLKNVVYIKSEKSLVINSNSTLKVTGILGQANSGTVQGYTSRDYSEIKMMSGSSININNSGKIILGGYIKEINDELEYVNTYKATVKVNSGGYIYMPYVINDNRGGPSTVGSYVCDRDTSYTATELMGISSVDNPNIMPMTRLDMPNVQTKIIVYTGGVIEGYSDIFTTAVAAAGMTLMPAQHNFTIVTLYGAKGVSSSTAPFILLKSNSEVHIECKNSLPGYTTDTVLSRKTTVSIYGDGVDFDKVTLTMTVLSKKITILSSSVVFGLSDMIEYRFYGGVSTLLNDFKLYPGCTIALYNDANLRINKQLTIYTSFVDNNPRVPYTSAEQLTNAGRNTYAELILNDSSSLTILSSATVGGKIRTTSSNCRIFIEDGASMTTTTEEGWGNMEQISLLQGYYRFYYIPNITPAQTENFELQLFDKNSRTVQDFSSNVSTVTYHSVLGENGIYGWVPEYVTISYNTFGFGTVPSDEVSLFRTNDEGIDEYVGYTINNAHFDRDKFDISSARPHFSYTWSKPADTIFENTTINAIWTPIEYAISYSNQYSGFTDTTPSGSFSKPDLTLPENSKYIKFTIESQVISLPTAENVEHENGYTFSGWYFKNDGTKVTSLDPSILKNYLNNGVVEIYAEWYPQESEKYSIYYHYLDENGTVKDISNPGSLEMVVTDNEWPASASCTYFNNYNTDNTNPINFDGWKTSINGDSIISALDKSLFDENNELHLYASLREKNYSLKVTYNGLVANKTDIYVYYDTATSYQLPEFTAFASEIISNTYVQKYDTYWYESVTGTKLSSKANITVNSKNMIATLTKETLADEQYYKVTITRGDRVNSFTLTTTHAYILTAIDAATAETVTINSGTDTDIYVKKNVTLTISVNYQDNSKNHKLLIDSTENSDHNSGSVAIGITTHTIYARAENNGCVTGDTLITLVDGSKKRIDELTSQDMLLAFNHFTGKYEATPIAALINHGEDVHDIMRLTFSDGTTLELIGRHGLFNVTLNEYSHFDTTTCFNFIDHEFIKYDNGVNKVVKLIDVTIYQKYVGSYTLITSQNLNSLANDMLNITTGMFGLYNIFEYDENHMFDKEQYELDVQKYGLYDYSVFEPYVEEQTFIDFGGKYFAVSIGKGYVDFETILGYIRWLDNMKQNGEASTN